MLDFVSKKFNTGARSSFVAELRNQLEAAHAGLEHNAFSKHTVGLAYQPAFSLVYKTQAGTIFI